MRSEIQLAALSEGLPRHTPRAETFTPAQKKGLRYQAKVEAALEGLFPGRVLLRPWFRYKQDWVVKQCQPDALIFGSSWEHVLIVEVKLSTSSRAWEQLHTLYAPVVEKAYRIPTHMALVVPKFDPHIGFPTAVTQLEGLDRLGVWQGDGLGVVSWK